MCGGWPVWVARYAVGVIPATLWNAVLNDPRLWKPTSRQISDAEVGVAEQFLRALDPACEDVLVRRLAERLLEPAAEVVRRDVRPVGERDDVERFGIGTVDEVLRAAEERGFAGVHRLRIVVGPCEPARARAA